LLTKTLLASYTKQCKRAEFQLYVPLVQLYVRVCLPSCIFRYQAEVRNAPFALPCINEHHHPLWHSCDFGAVFLSKCLYLLTHLLKVTVMTVAAVNFIVYYLRASYSERSRYCVADVCLSVCLSVCAKTDKYYQNLM